jgi:VWFA-related protein
MTRIILSAAVAAAATAFTDSAGHAQRTPFSTRVESVRVDVMVTDKGQPVRGLTAADFEIVDNNVRQQPEAVSFDEVPLNVVLLLDMSGSLSGERLSHLRSASHGVLDGLTTKDQAGLVTFRSSVRLGSALTSDLAVVRRAIDIAWPGGDTSLIDGAYAAMLVGESDVGRALVIAFSDGLDTSSWLTGEVVLESAKRSDVVVYGVSVDRAKPEFLNELATITGGRVFEVEKTANVPAVFASILQEFRHRYLISYTPRGVAKAGWHQLTVRVKRGGTVRARRGYLG